MTDFRSNALQIFINDLKSTCKSLDIICLNEVKLNLEEANLRLNFDGYQMYIKPRPQNPSFGGGVAVLVKDSIVHKK